MTNKEALKNTLAGLETGPVRTDNRRSLRNVLLKRASETPRDETEVMEAFLKEALDLARMDKNAAEGDFQRGGEKLKALWNVLSANGKASMKQFILTLWNALTGANAGERFAYEDKTPGGGKRTNWLRPQDARERIRGAAWGATKDFAGGVGDYLSSLLGGEDEDEPEPEELPENIPGITN